MIKGYHIYIQQKPDHDYSAIDHMATLASILFWKRNYGPITLFCNKEYLSTLQEYGLDSLYDNIDTTFLTTIPYQEHLSKYWSFCKTAVANMLVDKGVEEFVILDTDLWMKTKFPFDRDCGFIGYHPEEFDLSYSQNQYLHPETFVSKKVADQFDWTASPINCAILYLNNSHLVKEWYKWSCYIIESNKHKPNNIGSSDTLFIEQRLLPALASKLNIKVGTIQHNTYLTYVDTTKVENFGKEWSPQLGNNEWSVRCAKEIKHIWGAKRLYEDKFIRELIIKVITEQLQEVFGEEIKLRFPLLHSKISSIFN